MSPAAAKVSPKAPLIPPPNVSALVASTAIVVTPASVMVPPHVFAPLRLRSAPPLSTPVPFKPSASAPTTPTLSSSSAAPKATIVPVPTAPLPSAPSVLPKPRRTTPPLIIVTPL